MTDYQDPTDAGDPPRRESVLDDAEEQSEFPWSVPGSGARPGGATSGPKPASEGVRIIGADEAAAAIEAGQVANRRPGDAPRFGDVPEPPPGPRPSLRFPGADPAAVAKPPVVPPAPRQRQRGPAEEPLLRGSSWDDVVAGGGAAPQSAGSPSESPPRYAPRYVPTEYSDDVPAEESPIPFHEGGPEDGPATGATELPHWTEPPTGENPRIRAEGDLFEESDDDLTAWSTLSAGPRWRDQPTDWDDTDFGESVLDDPGAPVSALRAVHPDDEDQFLAPPRHAEPPLATADAEPRGAATLGSDGPYGPAGGRPRRRSPGPADPGGGRLVGAPPAAPRDVPTAIITGVVALAVVLVAALIGPGALTFLVGVALVMATAELYQAMRTNGYHPATLLGLAATASIVAAVYWRGEEAYPLVLALFFVFALLWYLTGVVRARPTMNVGATALGFLYVGFLGSFAALILGLAGKNGIGILLGAILATSAYDIGAFFVGRWAGKTPLAPELSPNKTVEGLVGGTFAALVVSLAIVGRIGPWDTGKAFWLAVIVAVAAPLGDLCESMIKRDLGVKDMGTLLPGHGGIFDRIDALLLVVPATYYLLRVLS